MPIEIYIRPGLHIRSWAKREKRTVASIASGMGITRQTLHRLMKGEVPLTVEYAISLEKITGITAQTWLTYEIEYLRSKERQKERMAVHRGPGRPAGSKDKFPRLPRKHRKQVVDYPMFDVGL